MEKQKHANTAAEEMELMPNFQADVRDSLKTVAFKFGQLSDAPAFGNVSISSLPSITRQAVQFTSTARLL